MRKELLAELGGTFALIFVGTGAILVNDATGGAVTHADVALAFGLIVAAMIYSLGDVSGAHINPAVTLGFVAARRISLPDAGKYVLAQCAGALAGSLLLKAFFSDHPNLGATLPAGPALESFGLEVALTLFLMFVILTVSTGKRLKKVRVSIAVGAVVGLEACLAGPISGASMNPARSLGPALASLHLDSLWIYVVAPVGGALAAIPLCRQVHRTGCCVATQEEPNHQGA